MRPNKESAAFTFLEIIASCAILAVLFLALSAPLGTNLTRKRVEEEKSNLKVLAAAVSASLESDDLEGTNILSLPGCVPTGTDSTAFSPSTDPAFAPATTNTDDWFAKIAKQTGVSPAIGVAPTAALQPQLARILRNPNQNARFLLLGPESEANQQRLLVGSLMAPAGLLAVCPLPNPGNSQDPANLALFQDIWNTDWESSSAVLPPSWLAALSTQQIQAWQGAGTTRGRLWMMLVQRITCPKYSVTINNSHPTDNCYLYYNISNGVAGSMVTVAANSGATVIPGLYSGRRVQVYRGTAPPPSAQLVSEFVLRDNCEITLQD